MLYLSDSEVTKLIDGNMAHVVDLMRQMFFAIAKGDYVLGGKNNGSHGMRISFGKKENERIFLAMPGYLGGNFSIAGMKWHGPSIPVEGNDADSYFIFVLNDKFSGKPLSIMRADTLTRYRTAAINALAAETLCCKTPKILSIIGPGRITQLTVKYLLQKFKSLEEIRIKGRGKTSTEAFVNMVKKQKPLMDIVVCGDVKDCIKNSDITIINTGFHFNTYGDMPIIREAWIKPGSAFICSAFASFPDNVLIKRSIKICDLYDSYECYQDELGYPAYKIFGSIGNRFADLVYEGKLKREDMIDFGNIICGKDNISSNTSMPIVFSSNGLVLEDIALAHSVYHKALEQKIGTEVD